MGTELGRAVWLGWETLLVSGWMGLSTCCIHDGLYVQLGGTLIGGRFWLGRFVSGAYLLLPTILLMMGGLKT